MHPSGTSAVRKVNLAEKLAAFHTHWDPKIVGELNGQQVKLAKFQGEFVWHQHEGEDELFLVIRGRFARPCFVSQTYTEPASARATGACSRTKAKGSSLRTSAGGVSIGRMSVGITADCVKP